MNRRTALVTLCFACTSPLWAASPWPAFRGPTADGHFVGRLPVRWSGSDNVAWKTPIPGKGWSSPVIADDRVYLTTAVPVDGSDDLALSVITVDANTGELIGRAEVFRQIAAEAAEIHTKNSHASPTAIIDGANLFVHFGHQGTACLDLDGKVVWKNRLGYQPVHGNGGSPLVVGDALIFSCDGANSPFIVCLDKRTGDVLWKQPRETDASKTFSFSTPTLLDVSGRQQVISPGSNTVDALEPSNGQLVWRVRYDGYSVIPKPVAGLGLVFICSGYDRPTLLAIRPDGTGDVTDSHVVWIHKRNVPHTPSLVLVGRRLFSVSDSGIASCLDAMTGRVHWQERLPGKYSASPIVADGRVYFLNEDGEATVIRAAGSFQKLASNSIGERTLASFAAASDRLFIRGDKHLYCISRR